MTYSDQLIAFVQAWEGCKLVPSGDPLVSGVVDVGYGHVLRSGEQVRSITQDEAHELLCWDLNIVVEEVEGMLSTSLAQYEFDALISFTYNLGSGALLHSTLLRLVNSLQFDAAADEFQKWVNASGRPAVGLVKRRAAEHNMFVSGDYSGRP